VAQLSYEEFLARAKEVQELDKTFGKQLRSLYVDKGTLQQLVRATLDLRDDLKEALAKNHIVNEESIRMAIGMQGQVSGIDTVLGLIFDQMNAAEDNEADEDEQSERSGQAP
jgi:hypothetical protein